MKTVGHFEIFWNVVTVEKVSVFTFNALVLGLTSGVAEVACCLPYFIESSSRQLVDGVRK